MLPVWVQRKEKKQTLRKLLSSLQTGSWQEGKNNHHTAICQKPLATYLQFVFRISMEMYIACWQKGGTRAKQQTPLPPTRNILFWAQPAPVFFCYLFSFGVAHTQWGWVSGQMVLSVWTRSWDRGIDSSSVMGCCSDPEAYWGGWCGPRWDRAPGTLWRQSRVRHGRRLRLRTKIETSYYGIKKLWLQRTEYYSETKSCRDIRILEKCGWLNLYCAYLNTFWERAF